MRNALLILWLLAGCHKVHKVFELTSTPDPKGQRPSAEEQKIIDGIESQTMTACESEGLTAEQADCILAMKEFDDMRTVTSCPAIANKKPSWLIAGPPSGK